MELKRASGILLHPTSLPSKYGIGDLGAEAYDFVDFLHRSRQRFWQILPLGPVGYGESPYQSLSAFAGNPILISIDKLLEEGLLLADDLVKIPFFPEEKVVFSLVKPFKECLLKKAFERFKTREKSEQYFDFLEENRIWLDNYSFFMALKEYFGGIAWNHWEKSIAFRQERALDNYGKSLKEAIEYHKFLQFKFCDQWISLKKYINSKGIKIIGDLPIFVSYDSSDAWSNPHLFELDGLGNPTKIAGVPPDYFSETGQLWGNPHYKWELMGIDDYRWWRERFSNLFKLVDIIRIDHFRGFEAYWEIPGGAENAINGKWVKAPGACLFATIRKYLGDLPIIAEDLGIITSEVVDLKDRFNFPGMKVMQFSLGSKADRKEFICNLKENTVTYTGTHDNDTVLGWYRMVLEKEPKVARFLEKYYKIRSQLDEREICWRLIEVVLQNRANLAILPLQDLLGLGSEARMNLPGTTYRNWEWRFGEGILNREIEERLAELTTTNNRWSDNLDYEK